MYRPDPASADVYDQLYAEYLLLHDYFGRGRQRGHAPAARDCGDQRPEPPTSEPALSSADQAATVMSGRAHDAAGRGCAETGLRPARGAGPRPAWSPGPSGNISARVPGADLMVIKPSGVAYDDLTPESMVVCDLDGRAVVDGRTQRSPSSDTATHAYVYRHRCPRSAAWCTPTRAYATAWAARGEPIPCVLTAMADEFGGEIPVGPFALIGGDEIGRGIVATLSGHRSPAVLMRSHGVFTIGPTARAAVKAAVMCEDVARTVHLARAFGDPAPLPQDQIDALHRRYQDRVRPALTSPDRATGPAAAHRPR